MFLLYILSDYCYCLYYDYVSLPELASMDEMQNAVPSSWDINEIVRLLRQERLFVLSEQLELQTLNEQVYLLF